MPLRSDGSGRDAYNCFAVDDEIAIVIGSTVNEGLRDSDVEAQAIDAGDDVVFLFEDEPATIHFLLHPVLGVIDEVLGLTFTDWIEELAVDTAVLLGTGVNECGSVSALGVALGHLLLDQLVEDVSGGFVRDWCRGFGASIEGGTAPTIREVNQEAMILRMDAGLVHFVGRSIAEIKSDVVHD